MKNIFTIILVMIWLPNIMLAQTTITSEKTITDIANGEINILTASVSSKIAKPISYKKSNLETGLIWQADAEWAVCNSVGISDITYQTFNGWHYNYRRVSYFGETSIPEWEFSLDASEYVHHDINSAGDFLVCAEGQMIHQLATLS
ncbi:MAG: hypothetical protein GQ527_11240, partial [Bacteroidales bacterium]|nr:hypothetical protein [Bacteroidales bacterium]